MLFNGSAPFLKRNLVITFLDSRLGYFCETKTNIDPVWCEHPNSRPVLSSSISPSIVRIVSDRFLNLAKKSIRHSVNIALISQREIKWTKEWGGGGGGGGLF